MIQLTSGRSMTLHLADFLKTNLAKFAVIYVIKGQRAGFLRDKLQNHTSEGKGKEKKRQRGGRKEEN